MPRWQIDPLACPRSLGDSILAYHAGSGDTHLLSPLAGEILAVLSTVADGNGRSADEILADHRLAEAGATDAQVMDALLMLEETGIVRNVTAE